MGPLDVEPSTPHSLRSSDGTEIIVSNPEKLQADANPIPTPYPSPNPEPNPNPNPHPHPNQALTLLSRDLYLAMGLLGCRTVKELKEKAPEILL